MKSERDWDFYWKQLRQENLIGGTIETSRHVGFNGSDMEHTRAQIVSIRWMDNKPHIIRFKNTRTYEDWGVRTETGAPVSRKKKQWKKSSDFKNQSVFNCRRARKSIPEDIRVLNVIVKRGGAYGFLSCDQNTKVALYPANVKVPKVRLFFGTGKYQKKKFNQITKRLFGKKTTK